MAGWLKAEMQKVRDRQKLWMQRLTQLACSFSTA